MVGDDLFEGAMVDADIVAVKMFDLVDKRPEAVADIPL